jgi:hypothetical protein
MSDSSIDLGSIARNAQPQQLSDAQPEPTALTTTAVTISDQVVTRNPDLVWLEATQGLQNDLLRTLRTYKMGRSDRQAVALHRKRMIADVSEQYVNYLREEAKLASNMALAARDSLLRQELTRLKARLFVELADLTGRAVGEIERIAQSHHTKLTSPAIQQAYATFIMSKIFDLLDQTA